MVRRLFPLAIFAALLVGLSGGHGAASPAGAASPVGAASLAPETQLAAVTREESTTALTDLLSGPTMSLADTIEVIETSTPMTVAALSEAPEAVVVPSASPAVTAAPTAPPPPAVCPANFFCYPRVGIAGPIVPYDDCTGSTDVGTAIRSLTCLSSTYLAAHAYTQFGRIADWRAGDLVFSLGTRYVLVDAFTQPGCVAPARAVAPLSLQTSLTAAHCGPILVVQGVIQER